eukprot:TRINITY_DN14039_c0_g1_i1.p1 TRINITY_DN14039_c0_g1~~TRINITY_DN14039_c0_g1_i1.p1  ORF type:complete len:151 (+),score=7.86 TRINITY_DN14039_c0_g1_i1:74-526(+)
MNISLSSEFGYVLLTAGASALVHNVWMGLQVGKARKKYGVKYPNMYASKETCKGTEEDIKAFNCVQRGHQNSLEALPTFYTMLILSGVKYPIFSAICGAVYVVGRILYFQGYSTGDPSGRYRGAMNTVGLLSLLGSTIKIGIDLIRSKGD